MPKIAITFTVRPDTRVQLEKHRRAAKVRRWSVNRLYLEAADKMAAEILETSKMLENPLTADGKMPALNQ